MGGLGTKPWLSHTSNAQINKNGNDCIERSNSRFFTISSLRLKLPPTCTPKWSGCKRVQITCNTLSAYHVQHVLCHLVRRDISAVKFDRVEITPIVALSYWLKPLTVGALFCGYCDKHWGFCCQFLDWLAGSVCSFFLHSSFNQSCDSLLCYVYATGYCYCVVFISCKP